MQNIFILTTLIATAAAWVIPTYVVRETTAATDTYIYSYISTTSTLIDKFTQTNLVTLSITTAPADATPITTITSTDSYNEFTMEYIELAAADLPTPLPTAPYDPSTVPVYHYYIQEETYSNPASCSDVEPWTYSTRVTVSIPSEATYQVKPTSESTDIYAGWVSTVTDIYHFLPPGTVPTSTSSYYSYYGSSETDACEKPYAVDSYDDDDDDDDYYYRWSTGPTSGSSDSSSNWDRYYGGGLKTYILVIIIVIPSVFVLGFVESYFWFTRLMKGRSALRGGTCLWVFISLWAACLIRSENAGADPEWRKEAEAKWKARGLGEKLKLWLQYGFYWSYPVAVMGERNLPPKHVPVAAAAAVAVAPTAPGKTGVAGSVETGETAGTGEGTRDVSGTVPPPYVDASKNPV